MLRTSLVMRLQRKRQMWSLGLRTWSAAAREHLGTRIYRSLYLVIVVGMVVGATGGPVQRSWSLTFRCISEEPLPRSLPCCFLSYM
jgi:hypothetical protein